MVSRNSLPSSCSQLKHFFYLFIYLVKNFNLISTTLLSRVTLFSLVSGDYEVHKGDVIVKGKMEPY